MHVHAGVTLPVLLPFRTTEYATAMQSLSKHLPQLQLIVSPTNAASRHVPFGSPRVRTWPTVSSPPSFRTATVCTRQPSSIGAVHDTVFSPRVRCLPGHTATTTVDVLPVSSIFDTSLFPRPAWCRVRTTYGGNKTRTPSILLRHQVYLHFLLQVYVKYNTFEDLCGTSSILACLLQFQVYLGA